MLEYGLARYRNGDYVVAGRRYRTKEAARLAAGDVNRERIENRLQPLTHVLTLPADSFDRQALVEALSKLPENELLALELIDGKGMSYQDAAKRTQLPVKRFATYLANARASLLLRCESMETAVQPEQVLNVDPL